MRYLAHTLFLILAIVLSISAQEPKPTPTPCDHDSNSKTRFENVRLTPPVRVLDWNGKELSVVYRDAHEVEYWTFIADSSSVIHLDGDYKTQTVWILFCLKEHHIYTVVPLTEKQKRGNK
jgi:hypothetical protein